MPLSEAEELELLELEDAEAQSAQPSPEPPAVPDEFDANGRYVVKDAFSPSEWGKAIKNEFTRPMGASASAAVNGPLGYMAGSQAGGAALSKGLGAVGGAIKGGAERFATSPVTEKFINSTDVSQKFGNAVSKMFGNNPITDIVKNKVAGRVVAYKSPAAPIQAVSDATRVARKGATWMLENAPEKLGKYAQVFSKAAASGTPQAVATTEFLLSQRDPEYQRIARNARDGEDE